MSPDLAAKLILVVIGVTALYAGVCTVSPVGRCVQCWGRRRIGNKACGMCKGRGKAPRLGAALVHRLLWEHVGPWLRDRLHDIADRLREAQQ